MSSATTYPIVRNKPVAKFRYRGDHSKPIRRTVLITEITPDVFTGYEVREGNELRSLEKAKMKSYSREKIIGLERFASDCQSW